MKISSYSDYIDGLLHPTIQKDPFIIMSKIYPQYKEYRKKWMLAGKKEFAPIFPLHLDFDLKDSCNLKCTFCHQNYRKRTNEKMPLQLFKKVITEGAEKGLCAVNLGSNGEPLIEKQLLLDALDFLRGKVMDIFMHTNAVFLDKQTSKNILDKDALTMICISVDAFSPEVYNKTRGAELGRTIDNILYFLSQRNGDLPLVRVSFVTCKDNENEIDEFKEFWKDKVDLVEIQDYRKIERNIAPSDKSKNKPYSCSDPWRRAMVWPNGDVTLCCSFREKDVLLGNCNGNTIEELWNSTYMQNIRNEFKRNNHEKGSTCHTCCSSFYGLK